MGSKKLGCVYREQQLTCGAPSDVLGFTSAARRTTVSAEFDANHSPIPGTVRGVEVGTYLHVEQPGVEHNGYVGEYDITIEQTSITKTSILDDD